MELFSRPGPPQTIRVTLTPSSGWCIKTTALHSAICTLSSPPSSNKASSASPTTNTNTLLEPSSPASGPSTLAIPQGSKIFINLAWDTNVPPPPEGSEDVIQKAMSGQDGDELLGSENPGWFVPVVISEPRSDIDKAGKPSAVFDAVFNSTLKSRALKDIAFKTFLEELAFQRIEDQHTLQLSRTTIGRPNIRSKGKLDPRTVLIPVELYPEGHPERVKALGSNGSLIGNGGKGKKVLVQEVSTGDRDIDISIAKGTGVKKAEEKKPKGILKPSKSGNELQNTTTNNNTNTAQNSKSNPKISVVPVENEQPAFSWTQNEEDKIILRVEVPRLTHLEIPTSTLDIEPHRLILTIPPFYHLDLNIDLPDAQMPVVYSSRAGDVSRLKRVVRERNSRGVEKEGKGKGDDKDKDKAKERGFDVGGAKAEWRVGEGVVVVTF